MIRMKTIPDENQWRILAYFNWESREFINYYQIELCIDEATNDIISIEELDLNPEIMSHLVQKGNDFERRFDRELLPQKPQFIEFHPLDDDKCIVEAVDCMYEDFKDYTPNEPARRNFELWDMKEQQLVHLGPTKDFWEGKYSDIVISDDLQHIYYIESVD